MSASARHRLELWFMRDLRDFERAPLFMLFGITHPGSNLEQQKAFEKILDGCSSSSLTSEIARLRKQNIEWRKIVENLESQINGLRDDLASSSLTSKDQP